MREKIEIIGERLNGSLPSLGRAIAERDGNYIRQTALRQAEKGADYLDVCVSAGEGEAEILRWMIGEVQSVTDLPLCLDSPDGKVLLQAVAFCKRPGIFNSVSLGREEELEEIFFFLKKHPGWKAIAMLGGQGGIPKTAGERLEILEEIRKRRERLDLEEERIYVDPLVEAAAFANPGEVLETMAEIRRRYPETPVVAAVSNISHGLPMRSYVNQSFVPLALAAGAGCLILDPTDSGVRGVLSASESLLFPDGKPSCMSYVKDYRRNFF